MKTKTFLPSALLVLSLIFVGCQLQPPTGNMSPTSPQDQTQKVEQLEKELANAKRDLLESKVRLEALSLWEADQVEKNPLNNEQFLILREMNDRQDVDVLLYDAQKDKKYTATGQVDLIQGGSVIYEEKLPENQVLYVAGMDGSKLALWQTSIDNSPGPCFDTWLADDLTSLNINESSPARKPYTLSEKLKEEAEKRVEACQKELQS